MATKAKTITLHSKRVDSVGQIICSGWVCQGIGADGRVEFSTPPTHSQEAAERGVRELAAMHGWEVVS